MNEHRTEPWWRKALPPVLTVGGLLVAWELCVRVGGVSERTLAAPSQIVASMVRTWPDLMAAAAVTTVEAVAGFLIAVAAVYGAVFYVVTTYFLKNRLNLE